MGRAPCCDSSKVKRGQWSPEEDATLKNYLENHGTGGNWIALPHKAGLKRCGKSCRLRWLNYLRPDIKHGAFTPEEDNIIFNLYSKMGSRWSVIASELPGRTDNDVKNHWNTKLKKKKLMATKDNPTLQGSSTPSAANLVPKIEVYNYNPGFSTLLNHDSLQVMPSLIDVNYGGLPMNNTQEGSTISDSSLLAMGPNYVSWSGNFGSASQFHDGISMDFGTGFAYDLKNSIWNQDQTIFEAANPTTNCYANSFNSSYPDTKLAAVLCPNVTNQFC